MNKYELLKDYEHPNFIIRKGVIKTESEWIATFEVSDKDFCDIKKDWFKLIPQQPNIDNIRTLLDNFSYYWIRTYDSSRFYIAQWIEFNERFYSRTYDTFYSLNDIIEIDVNPITRKSSDTSIDVIKYDK